MGHSRPTGKGPILSTRQTLELAAAVLTSVSAGLVAVVALEYLRVRLAHVQTRVPRFSLERAGKILARVNVPAPLARRWSGNSLPRRLAQAGLGWKPEALVGLRWTMGWLAVLASMSLILVRPVDLLTLFLGGMTLLAGSIGPGLWLGIRTERRQTEIDLALPDFLDRLALGLDAGLSFELAFRRTATNFRHLLGDEMRRVTRQIDRGHARSSALDELGKRNPSPDLQTFVATVKQAETLGTSLAEALRVQTGLLRARRRRRAEEASRRLPVLVVFPLVLFFLPALLIIYLAPPLLHLFLGH